MLSIPLFALAVFLPSLGSSLVVWFTLCCYFYCCDETSLFRAFKFLRRTGRNAS